jgi:hypothetical protein
MTSPHESTYPAHADRHEPHVFQPIDFMPMSPPFGLRGVAGVFTPTKLNSGKSRICGICRLPRADRMHIDGEANADAESPNWG